MNDLYSAVMHDIKNQLAELTIRLRKRGDAQQESEIAVNITRKLSEMLLLHREDAELLWVNSDTVNPRDFLEILAAEYKELFPQISIMVVSDQAPDYAFFDDSLVRLAFGNALHNACRNAKSEITLSAYQFNNMLALEVLDDGNGFPENILNLEGKLPGAASQTGTGLGIYLARKIAELHQLKGQTGYIELKNIPGACFRMMLP